MRPADLCHTAHVRASYTDFIYFTILCSKFEVPNAKKKQQTTKLKAAGKVDNGFFILVKS